MTDELSVATTPFDLVRVALQKDLDVDKLEKLLDMQKAWQAEQAFKAYADAMNVCQREMPIVIRDKTNDSTNSKFASLENVAIAIRPVYTANGFSLEFTESDSPLKEHRRLVCNVQHTGGHQKQFHLDSPLDDVGVKGTPNKTKIQGLGSWASYLRRYLTLLIFNISVADSDVDGNREEPTLTEAEVQMLETKILDVQNAGAGGPNTKLGLLQFLTAQQKASEPLTSLEQVKRSVFLHAIGALDKKIRTKWLEQGIVR